MQIRIVIIAPMKPAVVSEAPSNRDSQHAGARASESRSDVITTKSLFGSRRDLLIEHAGGLYRLRITRNNKLILTK